MIYAPGKNGKNSITQFPNKFTCQYDKFPNKNKLKYASGNSHFEWRTRN